jgi:CubicO group peptidase (beta-lactamase class C family)
MLGWTLVLGTLSPALQGQTVPTYAGDARLAQYDAAIARGRTVAQAIVNEAGVPGLSVSVGVNGEVVWSEGFGYADLELLVPVTPETRMRIGSVSKPVAAAPVGLLVQRGQLDLDAPVQRYVPTFPEKRWPITTRQMGGHLSGIRHYRGAETYSSRRYNTVLDGLAIFQDDTLLFEPGTRYSYSSYAWNLISAVVEGASGRGFLPFMEEEVFEPLGLRSIVAEHMDSIILHRSGYYQRTRGGGILNAPYVDNSYKWAGGGFISNTADLVRFGMAHIGGDFLAPETLETLWTSQRLNNGERTGYGIGWGTRTDYDGRRTVHHGGSSVGGRAFLLLFPDHGVVVAILANSSAPMSFETAWTLAEPFLVPETAQVSADQPDLSGMYACTLAARGDAPTSGTLELAGGPGDYYGRIVAGDDVSPIVLAWNNGNALRAIVLDDGFWVANLWLTVDGINASGRWNTREVECELR